MISAVVPAWNEEKRIGATVEALLRLPEVDEVVVVDDGSTDATARLAGEAGARVVGLSKNRGKGAALDEGVSVAKGDTLLLIDADLGECASQAIRLIIPILDGSADMTIAAFPIIPGKGGGFGFVVKLARWGIKRIAGQEMRAPLSGQRAVKRELLNKTGVFAKGFGAETALTIDALRFGYRVLEVETEMTHRVTGRDYKAMRHRLRQFLAVFKVLYSRWRTK